MSNYRLLIPTLWLGHRFGLYPNSQIFGYKDTNDNVHQSFQIEASMSETPII